MSRFHITSNGRSRRPVNAMMSGVICVVLLLVLAHAPDARADFGGPSVARHAMSPDGRTVVRIKSLQAPAKPEDPPTHEVSFYEFDAARDSYLRRRGYRLTGYLSQMLYVSNTGQLVMVSLGETDAICLYSREGKLTKSWNLADFLTKEEINACAETGSTLQWLEEAEFDEGEFYLRGPSRMIRALQPPYTVMRGVNLKITFSASIDLKTAKLEKHEPEAP